jgi:ribosome-associated translation inhibitor RaiA
LRPYYEQDETPNGLRFTSILVTRIDHDSNLVDDVGEVVLATPRIFNNCQGHAAVVSNSKSPVGIVVLVLLLSFAFKKKEGKRRLSLYLGVCKGEVTFFFRRHEIPKRIVMKRVLALLAFGLSQQQHVSMAFAPAVVHARKAREVLQSSRDEEIIKLEEQLRKLKEESTDEKPSDDDVSAAAFAAVADQRILEKVKGKDMLLSERELFDVNIVEDEKSGGSVVQKILIGVVALVFLGVFAQIPLGQEEYTKYSVGTTQSRTIDLGDLNTNAPRP